MKKIINSQIRNQVSKNFGIIHQNDVQNQFIQDLEKERKSDFPNQFMGDATKFLTQINSVKSTLTDLEIPFLTIFSGDIFSPSPISQTYSGENMLSILNRSKVDFMIYGNHDFDFGVENLSELQSKIDSKIVLSNLTWADGGNICNAAPQSEYEFNGIKILVIGLIESEWIDSLIISKHELDQTDQLVWCRKTLDILFAKNKQDQVIAITHMRTPHDQLLLNNEPRINIILGGHDHVVVCEKGKDNNMLMKSGSDFREFGLILVQDEEDVYDQNNFNSKVKTIQQSIQKQYQQPQLEPFISEDYFPQYSDPFNNQFQFRDSSINYHSFIIPVHPETANDQELLDEIKVQTVELEKTFCKTLFVMEDSLELQITFKHIRTKQSQFLNFLNRLLKVYVECKHNIICDSAMVNTGTYRIDSNIRQKFTFGDIHNMMPFEDNILVIRLSGHQLRAMVNNSVSQLPNFSGRQLCSVGMEFEFKMDADTQDRVVEHSIKLENGREYDPDQYYNVLLKEFLYKGKDGYDMLKDSEIIIDPSNLDTARNSYLTIFKLIKDQLRSKSDNNKTLKRSDSKLNFDLENLQTFYKFASEQFMLKDDELYLQNLDKETNVKVLED